MKAALIALALLATSSIANAWTITVTGTIYSDVGDPSGHLGINAAGIFGIAPGTSLIGSAYTETITTDPFQSTTVAANSSYSERYGGPGIPPLNSSGAPFVISVTVNGFTFIQTESSPYINRSSLMDGISTGLANADAINQQIGSGFDCSHANGRCISSYILAESFSLPFVPNLNFNQIIFAAVQLDPLSQTYFEFRNGPSQDGSINQYTGFYGSIDTIAVNVPEPSTWGLLLFGFAFLGMREIWPGASHE